MGYFKGFAHGVVVGAVLGVMIAPKTGAETRARIQRAAKQANEMAQAVSSAAQQGWTSAKPVVMTAARMVQPAAQLAGNRIMEIAGRTEPPGMVIAQPVGSSNGSVGVGR